MVNVYAGDTLTYKTDSFIKDAYGVTVTVPIPRDAYDLGVTRKATAQYPKFKVGDWVKVVRYGHYYWDGRKGRVTEVSLGGVHILTDGQRAVFHPGVLDLTTKPVIPEPAVGSVVRIRDKRWFHLRQGWMQENGMGLKYTWADISTFGDATVLFDGARA